MCEYDKEYQKQYRENHKEEREQYLNNNKEKLKQQAKQYRKEHDEEIKQYSKQYCKEHKEKIKENSAKQRGLGYISLMDNPFPDEIDIVYHHINNIFVVPVPWRVHSRCQNKNHRRDVNTWIEEHIGIVGVC